jgi:hypothetical protein
MSPFLRLDRWCLTLPQGDRTRADMRDGEKGLLVIKVAKRRIQARTEAGGAAPEELLFVTRERQTDGTFKHDYYLSNATPEEPPKDSLVCPGRRTGSWGASRTPRGRRPWPITR